MTATMLALALFMSFLAAGLLVDENPVIACVFAYTSGLQTALFVRELYGS
jgi:hypothetical protein